MKREVKTFGTILLLILLSGVVLFLPEMVKAQDPEPTPAPPQQEWQPKEIAVFYGMGGANVDEHTDRRWGWDGTAMGAGFEKFFIRLSDHYNDDGTRRFFVHLPFGQQNKWPMDFDAAVTIDEKISLGELPRQWKSTGANFTWWAGRFLRKHPDAKLTVYLGSLAKSQNMVRLAETNSKAYYDRFAKSIEPITNLHNAWGISKDRITIALDHLGGGIDVPQQNKWEPYMPKGSLPHRMIQSVAAQGWRVSIEPHFPDQQNYDHLFDFPVVASEIHWRKATTKFTAKTKYAHATVLLFLINETQETIDRTVRDADVDCIAVSKYKLQAVIDAQEAYRQELIDSGVINDGN